MFFMVILAQFTIVDSLYIPGGYLNGCAWTPDGLWITNNDAAPGTKIHHIDTTLGSMGIIATYNYSYLSGGFTGMAYANNKLWPVYWPTDDIWEVDPSDGSHDNTYNCPSTSYPYGMAYDGRWFWYTDQNDGTIYRIDPSTMNSTGSWSLGFNPKDCAFDGTDLYVMSNTNVLYQLDTATLSVISYQTFPRSYCAGLAFGGGAMWVGTNNATGKLYRVQWVPPVDAGETRGHKTQLTIKPNPARLAATIVAEQPTRIQIYNISGQEVFDRVITREVRITTGEMGGPGLYLVRWGSSKTILEFLE